MSVAICCYIFFLFFFFVNVKSCILFLEKYAAKKIQKIFECFCVHISRISCILFFGQMLIEMDDWSVVEPE